MAAARTHTMADAKSDVKVGGGLKCVVAGATGAIGKETVAYLLLRTADEIASVTVLVRKPKSFAENARLIERVVDYSALKPEDFTGFDVCFCCLGSTIKKAGSQAAFRAIDYDAIMAVATHAKAAGTKQFLLVSSVGADHTSSNFYLRTKGEAERDIAKLGFETFASYRPSVLEADRAEGRCGEAFAICCLRYVWCCCIAACCGQYAAINVRTVGVAMVKDALAPEKGVVVRDGSDQCEAAAKKEKK